MTTEALTVVVPAGLARELETASQEFQVDILERGLQALKVERALNQYARGGMSFGAAARLAGLTQSDLARQAYARGMQPPFSTETLGEELA